MDRNPCVVVVVVVVVVLVTIESVCMVTAPGCPQVELMDSSGSCGGACRGRVLRIQRRPVEAGLGPGA